MNKFNLAGKKEIAKTLLSYKFAIDEISTKITILEEEFRLINEYSPIEHVKTRVKNPKSILKKMKKKNIDWSIQAVEEHIRDIAGVRIVCSFEEDIYRIAEMLCKQSDITLIDKKDYIKKPKGNGYRSLHLIVKIPIFLSEGIRHVFVELQIRTIAMDFWASLEHKIYYKYNKEVPQHIKLGLKEAADQAAALDNKMAVLNKEINILKELDDTNEEENMDKYIREFLSFNVKA